jgi:hypothetical protein
MLEPLSVTWLIRTVGQSPELFGIVPSWPSGYGVLAFLAGSGCVVAPRESKQARAMIPGNCRTGVWPYRYLGDDPGARDV